MECRDMARLSEDQLNELNYCLLARGNVNAALEITHYREVYSRKVKVVKGRKVPVGTEGVVFWLKRYDYSKHGDPWGIYSDTKVGIRDGAGQVWFTSISNIEVIKEENT